MNGAWRTSKEMNFEPRALSCRLVLNDLLLDKAFSRVIFLIYNRSTNRGDEGDLYTKNLGDRENWLEHWMAGNQTLLRGLIEEEDRHLHCWFCRDTQPFVALACQSQEAIALKRQRWPAISFSGAWFARKGRERSGIKRVIQGRDGELKLWREKP